ncbi:Cyclin-dependent kinase D-3 CDKD-3 [Gracilaria domingensis]|nr:Cyclin-dependent kinase D-3 CDKD-3 [Gracilaria domingensis]
MANSRLPLVAVEFITKGHLGGFGSTPRHINEVSIYTISAAMVASLHGENRYEKLKALGEGTGLLDVYAGKNNVNMVIEYCVTDLEEVIRDRTVFLTPAEIKCCMKMILEGIAMCHEKWVLHRDLKPSNILVGADGNLKIADFGLARLHASPKARLTHQVITRWYRPPELLYAAKTYGPAVDIWSVGCIFAELILRIPYLPGDSDIDQLSKIFQARGTPTKEDWPDHDTLPAFLQFKDTPPPDQRQFFVAASPVALDLMNEMLHLNPHKRITAKDALNHAYFAEELPPACDAQALLEKIRSGNTVKDKGAPDDEADDSEADDTPNESQQKPSERAKATGQRKLSFS